MGFKRIFVGCFFAGAIAWSAQAENGVSCHKILNPEVALATKNETSASISHWQVSPDSRAYTMGFRGSRKVIRMTAEEYTIAAEFNRIDPDNILILDWLPLDVDLPVIAGVIVSTPLLLEGTHVQVQANKMGTPIIYAPGAFNAPELQTANLHGRYLSVKSENGKIEVQISDVMPDGAQTSMPPSVLPIAADRSYKAIVPASIASQYPVHIVGSKFKPLADLKMRFQSSLVPEIFSMTSGYYEAFVDGAHVAESNETLRQYIKRQLGDGSHHIGDEEIKIRLENIRKAILNAQIDPRFFEEISHALKQIFGSDTALSIRSNNEIEDLLAAGVFESSAARNPSPEQIKKAILKSWSSPFTYRSTSIRRFYNLREENLSMPLLVHPYIGGEQASGTGAFKYENGQLVFDAYLVQGSDEKATNPTANSQVAHVRIEHSGRYQESEIKIFSGTVKRSQQFELLRLFDDMNSIVSSTFSKRVYAPEEVEIEFLLMGSGPRLLQYKPRPPREIALAVLKGSLKLEDLEKEKFSSAEDGNIELRLMGVFRNLDIKYLHQIELNQLRGKTDVRYGVLQIGSSYRFIIWEEGLHSHIRDAFREVSPKISMVLAGYIDYLSDDSVMLRPEGFPVKAASIPGFARQIVSLALQTEFKKNPQLKTQLKTLFVRPVYGQAPELVDLEKVEH
jgi:hypothetical protein